MRRDPSADALPEPLRRYGLTPAWIQDETDERRRLKASHELARFMLLR
jgi:hypothetical protein